MYQISSLSYFIPCDIYYKGSCDINTYPQFIYSILRHFVFMKAMMQDGCCCLKLLVLLSIFKLQLNFNEFNTRSHFHLVTHTHITHLWVFMMLILCIIWMRHVTNWILCTRLDGHLLLGPFAQFIAVLLSEIVDKVLCVERQINIQRNFSPTTLILNWNYWQELIQYVQHQTTYHINPINNIWFNRFGLNQETFKYLNFLVIRSNEPILS